MNKPVVRKLRCAVYTRKSSEEGLEQEFNSLHAQREACEAFIASQRSEGWVLVRDQYDDGGISGGTLERPGLKRLLADIGYGLELADDIDPALSYAYGEQEGFQPSPRGHCSGRALIALRDGQPAGEGDWRVELRRLMRELVRRQLGGRELETAKLLRQLRRQ